MVVEVGFCGCEVAKVKIYLLRRKSEDVAAKVRGFPTRKNLFFCLTALKMVERVGFCGDKAEKMRI
jgi:hypothetical protein